MGEISGQDLWGFKELIKISWFTTPPPLQTLLYVSFRTNLDHLADVTFRSSELSGRLDSEHDYEVQVVPHVVLRVDVLIKRHGFVIKC